MGTRKRGFGAAPGNKPLKNADDWVTGSAEQAPMAAAPRAPAERVMRLSVDMPQSMHTALKMHAVRQGRSMTDLVRDMIRRQVDIE